MTNPLNGLRFDIYERVNLSEDVAAVEELEEIELVPRMQALNQGDQTLLKGHLLLIGLYRSSEQRALPLRLEHKIPVEISLPAERLQDGEDLTVEIDNFDVDLLSPRSINVTGVLALRGLQTDLRQLPVWRDDSFTVVHQSSSDVPATELSEEAPPEASADSNDGQTDSSMADPAAASNGPFDARDAAWDFPIAPVSDSHNETSSKEWRSELALVSDDGSAESAGLAQEALEGSTPAEPANASETETSAIESITPVPEIVETKHEAGKEEKPELKVAFGVKTQTAQSTASGVGLLSMLGDNLFREEAPPQAQATEQPSGPKEELPLSSRASTGDELEWTKLFISNGGEVEPFRKVRMCIVQRSDTLESIASRYNLQPRELQQRNRLNDVHLSEGQVLYIP